MVKEWNLLRAIACLTIVFLHSTTHIKYILGSDIFQDISQYRVLLVYATPAFVVLSEIILANKYHNRIPDGFFRKRAKYIFGPFIVFAIIDVLVQAYKQGWDYDIGGNVLDNLLGNFQGYFILIIFQFYVLHYLIVRFQWSVKKLLPISILVMMIHLSLLNSGISFFVEYHAELRLPFTAWFGYFTTAFLIGKHYDQVKEFLREYKWLTLVFVFFSAYLIVASYESGYIVLSSRRTDLLPFVISICLAVIAWGQLFPNLKIVNLISNYSLGIYLIHWQVQQLIYPYMTEIFPGITTAILGLFFLSFTITLVLIKLISLLPFGEYIVGKTKRKFPAATKELKAS
ncbi:acyltransferase family protein [Virgibacillus sediminis]|uniref:Acyltransferase family protein n=1 Tax=Virgibacillus sediminis TaxID=202260 RepID=A0ABV7A3Q0_9BACI